MCTVRTDNSGLGLSIPNCQCVILSRRGGRRTSCETVGLKFRLSGSSSKNGFLRLEAEEPYTAGYFIQIRRRSFARYALSG